MWYTCISGYRKRTPHFRLLPMVKCPLDCFLVYSFLLDVEQAKIRHAPFGTFAFSDKPLRNPSEHSDFWYIQGRIFSSCGLSETQGLPRSLVRFRAHRGDTFRNRLTMIRDASRSRFHLHSRYSQSFVIRRHSRSFAVNLLSLEEFCCQTKRSVRALLCYQKISSVAAKRSNDSCFFSSVASA